MASNPTECRCDGELMPRWRGPEVMDDDSKAMGFVCHECQRDYLPNLVKDRRLIAQPT
jgi:hypothetical protein